PRGRPNTGAARHRANWSPDLLHPTGGAALDSHTACLVLDQWTCYQINSTRSPNLITTHQRKDSKMKKTSRRDFLKLSISAATIMSLHACAPKMATTRMVKIGYISPQTGALAGFTEADDFILKGMRALLANGISVGGTNYPIEILAKDSQSDPNRA